MRSTENFLSNLWRMYAKLRRARVHPSVIFKGCPLIYCVRGAELRFEQGVKVNSSCRGNPAMGSVTSRFHVACAGARLVLGPHVGASGVSITAAREVLIGEGTLLGADCLVTDTDFHVPQPNNRWGNDLLASAQPVHIGKGCFIGARAIILKGVTVGDGAVVGAGAVVARDVPSMTLAVGNPACIRPLPPHLKR